MSRMTLEQYLKYKDMTHDAFARQIKVGRVSVSRYLNKTRIPALKVAKRIVKATRGDVSIEDLYR